MILIIRPLPRRRQEEWKSRLAFAHFIRVNRATLWRPFSVPVILQLVLSRCWWTPWVKEPPVRVPLSMLRQPSSFLGTELGRMGLSLLRFLRVRNEWRANTVPPRESLPLARVDLVPSTPSRSRSRLPLSTPFTWCPIPVILHSPWVPLRPRSETPICLCVSSRPKKRPTAPSAMPLAVSRKVVPVLLQCIGLTWWPYPMPPMSKTGRPRASVIGMDTNRWDPPLSSRSRQLSEAASDSAFLAS